MHLVTEQGDNLHFLYKRVITYLQAPMSSLT